MNRTRGILAFESRRAQHSRVRVLTIVAIEIGRHAGQQPVLRCQAGILILGCLTRHVDCAGDQPSQYRWIHVG